MCFIQQGFDGPWYRYLMRFILLFSYIIPISLRVNLDMGKAAYSFMIQRDKDIEGTVVRSTTIPEELGRGDSPWAFSVCNVDIVESDSSLYCCL